MLNKDFIEKLNNNNIIYIQDDSCQSCFMLDSYIKDFCLKNNISFFYFTKDEVDINLYEELNIVKKNPLILVKNKKVIDIIYGYIPEEILKIYIDTKF